jgi:alpha,alpha-trehalase
MMAPKRALVALVSAVVMATAWQVAPSSAHPRVAVQAVGRYEPERDLGPLFKAVALAGIFKDSKTFPDAHPRFAPAEVVKQFTDDRSAPAFDLGAFVARDFELPRTVGTGFKTDTTRTMEEHIRALWPALTRAADTPDPRSSLIPLPNPYVVPGGRFREVYYWDSYFTMLGLVASGRVDLVRNMLDNFASLVVTVGHIPNGNRTYYLGRSQPPFFAAMVGLYARAADTAQALRYLDALDAEHAYWMAGADSVRPGQAHRRVVRLAAGAVLNRYWDDAPGPRPESYREDFELAQSLPDSARDGFYRSIRAGAESGWDFSSRWLRAPGDLKTIETTELIPIDLNAVLYDAGRTIAALHAFRKQPGDSALALRFNREAERRRNALLAAAYDARDGYFYDVRWRTGQRVTDRPTLAVSALLYFGLPSSAQASRVAQRLERDFLEPGGFVTTTIRSGQQWDSPNGWAPLEWMAIEGLRRYGKIALANSARDRWLGLNRRTYRSTGSMMEKYNVVDVDRAAGGGEYGLQDGFGWTNGVALALIARR